MILRFIIIQAQRPPFQGEPDDLPVEGPPEGESPQYTEATCAPGCGRKFPQSPAPQPILQYKDEVVLGDPSCQPVKVCYKNRPSFLSI